MPTLEELGFAEPSSVTEAESAAIAKCEAEDTDKLDSLNAVSAKANDLKELISSASGTCGLTTPTTEKALNLLGSGINAEQTAAALGVTPSRISQLLAVELFAEKVAQMRYANLQKHNVRDNAYDNLEDKLLAKLDRAMPMLIKPESILKAMQIVNGAKRRGQPATQTTDTKQLVVNLTLPTVIAQKFSVDTNNQVVKAGEQSLITMPSGNLLDRVEAAQESAADN